MGNLILEVKIVFYKYLLDKARRELTRASTRIDKYDALVKALEDNDNVG